jgi:ribosome-binding factor A
VRHTPSLTFVADLVPATAQHMEDLLARTREADAELARLAANATPAGDPDPYRKPREIEDDDAPADIPGEDRD